MNPLMKLLKIRGDQDSHVNQARQARSDATRRFKQLFDPLLDFKIDAAFPLDAIREELAAGAYPDTLLRESRGSALYEAFKINIGDSHRLQLVSALLDAGANPFSMLRSDPSERSQWNSMPIIAACEAPKPDCLLKMLESGHAKSKDLRMFSAQRERDGFSFHIGTSLSGKLTSLAPFAPPLEWNMGMVAAHCDTPAEGLQAIQDNFERHVLPAHPELARNHLWTQVDTKGLNALMLSRSSKGSSHFASWLLENHGLGMHDHIDAVCNDGKTALWQFAERAAHEACAKLLYAGASLEVRNTEGVSLLDCLNSQSIESKPSLGDQVAALMSQLSDPFPARQSRVFELLQAFADSRAAAASIDAVVSASSASPAGSTRMSRP